MKCSLNSWSLSDNRPSKNPLLIKLSTPHTLTRRPTSFWSVRWNKASGDHESVFLLLAAHIYTLPLSLGVCEIRVSALIWCLQGGTREASFEDEQALKLKKVFFHQRSPAACFTPTPPLTSFSLTLPSKVSFCWVQPYFDFTLSQSLHCHLCEQSWQVDRWHYLGFLTAQNSNHALQSTNTHRNDRLLSNKQARHSVADFGWFCKLQIKVFNIQCKPFLSLRHTLYFLPC